MKNNVAAYLAVYIGIIRGKFVVFPYAYYGNMTAHTVCKGYRLGRLRRYYVTVRNGKPFSQGFSDRYLRSGAVGHDRIRRRYGQVSKPEIA